MKFKLIYINNRNLLFGIIALSINLALNLFVSPFIVRNLGVEANGYITLANNFVSYASLISVALNSMANRFITLEFVSKNYERANLYYSNVTIGNCIIGAIITIFSIFFTNYISFFLEIPNELIKDIKLLFLITFLTFSITTVTSSWNIATFLTNKLYIQSVRNIQSQFIRAASILILFYFFPIKVSFIAFSSFIAALFSVLFSLYYKKKLTPFLKASFRLFNIKTLKELVGSGIWNSVGQMGVMLLTGLDLLIANIFLGPESMGILALAKVLPTIISQLSSTVTNVFIPQITLYYGDKKMEVMHNYLEKAIALSNFIITIPIALIISLGYNFYSLWVPNQNIRLIFILCLLSLIGTIFSSGTEVLTNIFVLVNKIKINSLNIVFSGIISIIVSFVFVKYTEYGIFAIASVSSIVNVITKIVYTIPFSSKYINISWNYFYIYTFKSILSVILISLSSFLFNNLVFTEKNESNHFFIKGFAGVIIALIINFIIYRKVLFRRNI